MQRSYLPALAALDAFEVVALCDHDAGALSAAHALAPAADTVDSPDRLFERDDVDAVVVSTPTDSHVDLATAALQAGKHVFCEKPLAPHLDGIVALVREAQAHPDQIFQVGFVYRYAPLFRDVAQMVLPRIGPLRQAWAHEFRAAFYRDWRFRKERSGGALLEKIGHHADLFNVFTDSMPSWVAAVGGQAVMRRDNRVTVPAVTGEDITVDRSEILDHAWVIARTQSGIPLEVGVNFFAPHGPYGHDARDREHLEIGLIGDAGMARIYPRRNEVVVWDAHTGERIAHGAQGDEGGWHIGTREQFASFAACITDGKPARADAIAGLAASLLPLAAERAIEGDAAVNVEDMVGGAVSSILERRAPHWGGF